MDDDQVSVRLNQFELSDIEKQAVKIRIVQGSINPSNWNFVNDNVLTQSLRIIIRHELVLSSTLFAIGRFYLWTEFCDNLYAIPLDQQTPWFLPANVVTPDASYVVRLSAYDNLINHATNSPVNTDPPLRSLIVDGQSGIGKSTFAIFLIRALMSNGDANQRRILFSTIGDNCIYSWHNGTTSVHSYTDAPVTDANAVWIINQSEHGPYHRAKCRKVLIVSAGDARTSHFRASAGSFLHVVYMPLPTEAEARAVAAAHGVPADQIDVRLRQVGPICRYLAANEHQYCEELKHLDVAIDQCQFRHTVNNSEVVQLCGEPLTHRVFYQNADANFTWTRPTLGAPFIIDKYMRAWRTKRPDSFLQLIASRGAGCSQVEYATAFAEFGHAALMSGGSFRVRTLHHRGFVIPAALPNIRRMKIPPRAELACPNSPDFETLSAEDSINNVFLKPIHGNFGAVSSVVINPTASGGAIADMYHFTTDVHHEVDCAELDSLIDRIEQFVYPTGAVDPNYTIRLLFVVPDYQFEQFARQPYRAALSDVRQDRLEQHVLELVTRKKNVR